MVRLSDTVWLVNAVAGLNDSISFHLAGLGPRRPGLDDASDVLAKALNAVFNLLHGIIGTINNSLDVLHDLTEGVSMFCDGILVTLDRSHSSLQFSIVFHSVLLMETAD